MKGKSFSNKSAQTFYQSTMVTCKIICVSY